MLEKVNNAAPLLFHPSGWVRHEAVRLVAAVARWDNDDDDDDDDSDDGGGDDCSTPRAGSDTRPSGLWPLSQGGRRGMMIML
jgi:hypothetical protein